VSVSRALRRVDYPARFQLIAAMNPCPCGYQGHPNGRCRCTPDQVARYRGRLSGPFLDRMDIFMEVPALSADELQSRADGEASASVRARVVAARERQMARQGKANARLGTREVEHYCLPDEAGKALIQKAIARLMLSARAYHRILRVARTVADMEGSDTVRSQHVAEAVHYRRNEFSV
jgi:magnesium chelatase family protein